MVTASPPSPSPGCPLYIDIRPYGQHLPCIMRMRNKVDMYKVFVVLLRHAYSKNNHLGEENLNHVMDGWMDERW
jgi:hypothetical protein